MDIIFNAIEAKQITEICFGHKIEHCGHALMITKACAVEYMHTDTQFARIVYPFKTKSHNPYINWLQIQLNPKYHVLWHIRSQLRLDEFDSILQFAKRFPNNYYCYNYIFNCFTRNSAEERLTALEAHARQQQDHGAMWCFYRCCAFTEKQDRFVLVLQKMDQLYPNETTASLVKFFT